MTKAERIEEELQKLQVSIEQIIGYEPGTEETRQHLYDLLDFYWERVEEDFQSMEGEAEEVRHEQPPNPAHLRAESFKRLVAHLKQMESKVLFRIGPFEIRRRK